MAATSGKTQWSAANRLAGSHQLFRPDSVQTLIPRRYRIKKKDEEDKEMERWPLFVGQPDNGMQTQIV